MATKVLIVGTGLGGLTTALRLAKDGYEVEMVEKYHQAGGRLNQLKKDGFTFDIAPTFFSMSYEFKEFADYCNIEIPFEFVELDPLYKVNFADSERFFTIYKDLKKLAEEFKDIEPGFERKMKKYLESAGRIYHDTEDKIIKSNFKNLPDYLLRLTRVPIRNAPKLFGNMWSEMEKHFTSYEVKVIFSLVAFFLGATPFDTPAIFSMLTYTELVHDGYHNVRGGMYKIVEGLLRELEKENVKIHYNTEIVDYTTNTEKKISGLTDHKGNTWKSDLFVINSDAAWFRGKVFGRKKYSQPRLDKMKWTLAPFTMYLGVKEKIKKGFHHNYFLGNNFKEYAGKIFKNSISLEKPYYYVNISSKFNTNTAPPGHENLFILCPVPDLRYKPNWDDREELAEHIIKDLSTRLDFDIKNNLVSKTIFDPVNWKNMFNLYRGSGLSLAHDLDQVGGFRPRNEDEQYKNVYYVGSSTIPGTGLPMAVISSKLVTEKINYEHSTLRKKQFAS
ncbi:MAG: phytoene desaturase family protein [Bacteroidales bacterium]